MKVDYVLLERHYPVFVCFPFEFVKLWKNTLSVQAEPGRLLLRRVENLLELLVRHFELLEVKDTYCVRYDVLDQLDKGFSVMKKALSLMVLLNEGLV